MSLLLAGANLPAATHYVSLGSTNSTPPFTNWVTAANNIQDAVAAASAGDDVVVTNGVYAGGVAVTNPLVLTSVNGAQFTVIDGGATNQCASLTEGASLTGFTLTNGYANDGNGGGVWCASTNASLTNCTLTGNSATNGGGAYNGTLYNCTLTGNSAHEGGGAFIVTLFNCTLTGNSAIWGGGAHRSTLNNCTLSGNSANNDGGGAHAGMLNNCTLSGNSASRGGGAYSATLNNCTLSSNSAARGGGASYGTLNNCTLSGNSANALAGGAAFATLNNCIVYYNSVANHSYCTFNYSCTTPMSPNDLGNFTNAPLFVDYAHGNLRLQSNSPCINAGNNSYVTTATDLDGRPRIGGGTVDMGAYEYRALLVWQGSSGPTPPFATWATAATSIQDAVDAAVAGDDVVVTNGVYAGGVAVTNPLALTSVNGAQFTIIDGGGTNRCASLTNGASLTGFILTNGYANDGNGGSVWCASTNALLTNCVVTGNSAYEGGGVYGGTLCRCALTGNSAVYGGGAAESTLNGCTLIGNWASYGGGASASTLMSCLVVSNSVNDTGAGAFDSTLNDCTVWGNTAEDGASGIEGCNAYNCIILSANEWGNYAWSTLSYCCTTPLPDGVGNITNDPLFADDASGNLRLQSNSPCINAGNNAYATTTTDLDGNPRIVSVTVDIGAYEYQGAGSVISYAWLQQYGLPTDGSADYTDPDHDGLNNYQEWVADTNPTNAASALRLIVVSNSPPVAVTFSSSAARLYTLLSCTNLTRNSVWTPVLGQLDLPGSGAVLTLTDTNPPAPAFYRVSVRFP